MISSVVKFLNIFFLARLLAVRYGAVTTAIVEKLVLVMNPQEHKAFEAFVQQVASFLARPALARPQQPQQAASTLGDIYNQAAAIKPAFEEVSEASPHVCFLSSLFALFQNM